jgi:hypothetical protein
MQIIKNFLDMRQVPFFGLKMIILIPKRAF